MKFQRYNRRVHRAARWLLPGMEVKRWFSVTFIGAMLVLIGGAILLDLHPVHSTMEFLKKIAENVPPYITGGISSAIGLLLFYMGWKHANRSLMDAVGDSDDILENVYRRRKLNRGPKIVAIGGGTGLSTILKGLKHLTNNITAVVTVGDDGGSSGRLREEMGVLPPGDIRNCIAALAKEEDLVTELFQYRFKKGHGLEGHSFGNLFLSALCAITGDMVMAVKESSKVLAIRGKVLPSTLDDMKLIAELEDGRVILGESNIPEAKGKIRRLKSNPANLNVLEDVIEAVNEADLIIMGPGSLYTSVIPNLLIEGVTEAISKSSARKLYICNIMTQPGETDGYSVSDHVKAILDHSKHNNILDTVLVNDSLPKNLTLKYKAVNSHPVKFDVENIKKLGVKPVTGRFIEEGKDGLVRHSPQRLAKVIYTWFKSVQNKSQEYENTAILLEDVITDK